MPPERMIRSPQDGSTLSPRPGLVDEWSRGGDMVDVVLTVALVMAGQVEVWGRLGGNLGGIGTAVEGPRVVESVLALAATVSLPLRRRRPLGVATLVVSVLAIQVLSVAREVSLVSGLFPLLLVVYSAARHADSRWRAGPLAAAVLLQALFTWLIPMERATGEILFGLFVMVGSFLVGDTLRARHLAAGTQARALAEQLASEQANREAWTAAVLAQERAAIARELHDVIAHGVSVMGVQASAAGVLVDRDPASARTAMLAIENLARESVGELQRLLGVLRESEPRLGVQEGNGVASGLAPQPALQQLGLLVDQMRAAGLPVDLDMDEGQANLSVGAALAGYRIVQEALTNVLKHAGKVPVRITIRLRPTCVDIRVLNDGVIHVRMPTPGHGLIGMRERVGLYGGTLDIQTPVQGGFLVHAQIPIRADDP